MNISTFLDDPFFVGLCIFLLSICSAIVQRAVKLIPQKSATEGFRRRRSNMEKVTFWKDHPERYNTAAAEGRTAWALEEAKIPPNRADMPNPNMGAQMLGMLSGFGPSIILNFVLSGQVVMYLPFDPPTVLRHLLQINVITSDPRAISLHSLYLLTSLCSSAFARLIPLSGGKHKVIPPQMTLEVQALQFHASDKEWELERADEELLSLCRQN